VFGGCRKSHPLLNFSKFSFFARNQVRLLERALFKERTLLW
jgi:hypothetical protein